MKKRPTDTSKTDGLIFAGVMGIAVLLGRENPRFIYPQILLVFLAFLLFNLLRLSFLTKDLSARRRAILSVSGNTLLLTLIILFSGGPDSSFWVLFLLPIFSASVNLERRDMFIATGIVIALLLGLHHEALLSGNTGRMLALFTQMATITASAFIVMRFALRERHSRLTLETQGLKIARERTQTREKLQHMDRLATMGTLTASITHELNSPLAVILAHVQLTRRPNFPKEEIKNSLTKIEISAKRCSKIIQDMLSFSRRKQDQQRLESINSLVQQCVDLKRIDWELAGVSLEMKLAPEIPQVLLSPSEFQQVIFNLLTNSFQALRGAGVDSGKITVETRLDPGQIRLIIADNGPGVSADNQEKIWETFFTTKKAGEGTGLGLGICRQLIQAQGGNINLTSPAGAGAEFTVTLPSIEKPARLRREDYTPPAVQTAVDYILLAEDDPDMADLVMKLLKPIGLPVTRVSSFNAAIAAIEDGRPRLFITDLHMPGMSMLSFFRWFEERGFLRAFPVVVLSGSPPGSAVENYLTERNFPFLRKPFDIDDFKDLVSRKLKESAAPRNS